MVLAEVTTQPEAHYTQNQKAMQGDRLSEQDKPERAKRDHEGNAMHQCGPPIRKAGNMWQLPKAKGAGCNFLRP